MKIELLVSYIELGYSAYDIAKTTAKSTTTVNYWLKKYNLKTKYARFGKEGGGLIRKKRNYSSYKNIDKINWVEVQEYYNKANTKEKCLKQFNITKYVFNKANKKGLIKLRTRKETSRLFPRKMSEETKRKISEARRKFLKENPDKCHWKSKGCHKSFPCEKLKEWLKSRGAEFVEEYRPNVSGRSFSIDIAFPDKMIGIEVNGTQHYDKEGKLKPYYQERHDLIEAVGWKLYEIPYQICYKMNEIESLVPTLLNSEKKIDFDYKIYKKPTANEKDNCPICGGEKCRISKKCIKCNNKNRGIKFKMTKEELEKLIWEKTKSAISKDYQVGQTSIRKWCKEYNIIEPPKSYWLRRFNGQTHNEALKDKPNKIRRIRILN